MPWRVEKGHGCPDHKPFALVKTTDGSVVACHPSHDAATQQQKALYAQEDTMAGSGRAAHPPTDTHAGERHNEHDIGFLYHMAASLQGSIGAASHAAQQGVHSDVQGLAGSIVSSHQEQLGQVGKLQQKLGVGTGTAVASAGSGHAATVGAGGHAATAAGTAAAGGGGGRSRRSRRQVGEAEGEGDWDDDPGHLAQAADAALDEALEAFQMGETDQGHALVVAAATSLDALLAALNVVDADEVGAEPAGSAMAYASASPRITSLRAQVLPTQFQDERLTARSGEAIRTVPFELAPSSDGLTLEGYAAVFNSPARIQDRQGEFEEVILPGAFGQSLRERKPVLMFEHGRHPLVGSMPLGIIQRAEEDSRGLHITARLTDNWLIQPVRDAVRDGAITGMSFRFSVPEGGDKWTQRRDELDLRAVSQVDMRELGPVVFPAYEPTTASVRSALDHLSDLTGRSAARSTDGGGSSGAQPGNGAASPEQPSTLQARDRVLRLKGVIRASGR